LRRDAKWHDGAPVMPEDVIFSFEAFKNNNPQAAAYYRRVVKAERSGDRDVTFTFAAPGSRELPQIVGQLAIVPRHWWMASTGPVGNAMWLTPRSTPHSAPGRIVSKSSRPAAQSSTSA
jgi:ABC-type oligopeptide transport system substrate-binding subunit